MSSTKALNFAKLIKELLVGGKHVVIHCRAGIGRSSIIAAGVLMMSGVSFEEAFEQIEKARGCSVPDTEQQKEWVRQVFVANLIASTGGPTTTHLRLTSQENC